MITLQGMDLSDKQKDELKKVPDKLRADLLKEMKSILNDEQYRKLEAALKKAPLPPLRLAAPPRRAPAPIRIKNSPQGVHARLGRARESAQLISTLAPGSRLSVFALSAATIASTS